MEAMKTSSLAATGDGENKSGAMGGEGEASWFPGTGGGKNEVTGKVFLWE